MHIFNWEKSQLFYRWGRSVYLFQHRVLSDFFGWILIDFGYFSRHSKVFQLFGWILIYFGYFSRHYNVVSSFFLGEAIVRIYLSKFSWENLVSVGNQLTATSYTNLSKKKGAGSLWIFRGKFSMMKFYLRGRLGTRGWGISSVENALSSPQIKCEEHLKYPQGVLFIKEFFIHSWKNVLVGIGMGNQSYLINIFILVTPQ